MTDTIKDKIRKLLATAEGKANENESQVALEMARKLMLKHGIDQSTLHPNQPKPPVVQGNPITEGKDFYRVVIWAVNALFNTSTLHWKLEKNFRFVGRSENVMAAEETFAYLILQIEYWYKEYLPSGMTRTDRSQFRKTFKMAAACRVNERCKELTQAPETTQITGVNALVIVGHVKELKSEIAEYFASMKVKSSKKKLSMGKSLLGQSLGNKAGNQIDLHSKTRISG